MFCCLAGLGQPGTSQSGAMGGLFGRQQNMGMGGLGLGRFAISRHSLRAPLSVLSLWSAGLAQGGGLGGMGTGVGLGGLGTGGSLNAGRATLMGGDMGGGLQIGGDVCVPVHVCVYTSMRVSVHVCVHVCVYLCMYVCVYIYACECDLCM